MGGNGPVLSWEVYDLSLFPKDKLLTNSRLLKYASLTNNLTKMMASVYNLYRNPDYERSFDSCVLFLTSRLTWIMLYFYGAMSHYKSWIFGQTQVESMAQTEGPHWITFKRSLGDFFIVLASLPDIWLEQGINSLINDVGQQQIIPAEAPLKLIVQIFLNVHESIHSLRNPDKTMPFLSLSKFQAESRSELSWYC